MNTNSLVIFIKNPVLGKVKTRLAADIGDSNALEVYKQLLNQCNEYSVKVHAQRFLYFSDFIDKELWDNELYSKKVQSGADLGERMLNALREVFDPHKNQKVVIIGSDCYELDHRKISSAFDSLNYSDLVIGPANDGGYYLLGMNQLYPELFQGIAWSTEKVLRSTLKKANELELSYVLLEQLIDLDTFDDLKKSKFPYPI